MGNTLMPQSGSLMEAPSGGGAPLAHAPSHITGGGDIIPTATAAAVGLCPMLSGAVTDFLNGTGAFSVPTGIVPAAHAASHTNGGDQIATVTNVAAGLCPTLSNVATQYLNGVGGYSVPAGTATSLGNAYTAGATITLAGNAPVIIDDLTAAYTTVGLLLSNSTVATGASNRYAPTLRFQANSWNGASTPDYIDMTMRALDGAVPALYIHYSRNGAAEVDLAYFGWNVGFAVMRNVYLCSEATSYHTYFGNPGSTNIMRNEHEYNTGYMHYIQGWQINNVVAAGFINDGWTFPATATKGTITGNGAFAFDLRDTDTATAPDLYLFKFGWKSSVASCVPIWGWTDGDFYCNGDIYNAYKGDLSSTEELVVLNAVTLTSAKQFPTNSIIEGCAIYVTEAITGGATGFTVGITTDLNLFATVATVTLGTTNSGEADSYVKATGATGVTITFTGGTPDGVKGRIRVKLFWRKQTAPTS